MSATPPLFRYLVESAHRIHGPITAWIILALSLAITLAAYSLAAKHQEARSLERFDFTVQEIRQLIDNRMQLYVSALRSGVALMDASEHVSREEWKTYVDGLELSTLFPGIQGMGLSIPLQPDELSPHIDGIRAEGFDTYTVKPEGARDLYSAIIYLEPFDWRNKRAFGYDMWSNPARRVAMRRAWETGQPSTSGMITLVQETDEDVQRGFLIYLPVYEEARNPSSGFRGWVYAAFRAKDLMQGILRPSDVNIEFQIYDGETTASDAKIYDTNAKDPIVWQHQEIHKVTKTMDIYGRPWTLVFEIPMATLLSKSETIKPGYILVAGLIIDTVLFLVLLSLAYLNRKLSAVQVKLMDANKKIKSDLIEKQETLRISERKNDVFLELAPVSLVLATNDGTILTANSKTHDLFGYTAGELDSKPLSTVLPGIAGQEYGSTSAEKDEAFWAQIPQDAEICMQGMRQNDIEFPVIIHATKIMHDAENFDIALVIRDTTEQNNYERRLSEAKAKAEHSSKSKSAFVANMSHEIRTPLNAVLGSAQLLEKTRLDQQQSQYIQMIRAAGEGLLGIINDILDFSKIEAGQLALVNTPFSLHELLHRVGMMMQLNIGEKPIVPVIDLAPDVHAYCVGDSLRLQQVLYNLIANAIKFTERGQVCLRVNLKPCTVPGRSQPNAATTPITPMLHFAVSDSGIGIKPEDMNNLFIAFSQADSSITRRFGGTGLGLVISNRLVKMMGGEIAVQSAPDVGSTFSFSLPLPEYTPDEQHAETRNALPLTVVIEQHEDSAVSLKHNLSRLSERSIAFSNGYEFLQTVSEHLSPASEGAHTLPIRAIVNWESCASPDEFCDVLKTLSQHCDLKRDVLVTCGTDQALQHEVSIYLKATENLLAKPVTYTDLKLRLIDREDIPDEQDAIVTSPLVRPDATPVHVLVVEDVDFNQIIITSMLDELGVEYSLAGNGQEAIELYQATPDKFDLILMDIQMPVMDGVTATKIFRGQCAYTKPIIALTAAVLKSEHDSYLAAGIDELLPKPVDFEALEQLLIKSTHYDAKVA